MKHNGKRASENFGFSSGLSILNYRISLAKKTASKALYLISANY